MPEYRTPGVYIEEISTGPRPVQASTTTDTGFVSVLTLPSAFHGGLGQAEYLLIPDSAGEPLLDWNRALAFRGLLAPPKPPKKSRPTGPSKRRSSAKDGEETGKADASAPATSTAVATSDDDNRFLQLLSDVLPGEWEVEAPNGGSSVLMSSSAGQVLKVPARRTLLSVKEGEWDLAFTAGDDRQRLKIEHELLRLMSSYAVQNGISYDGDLNCVDSKQKTSLGANEEEHLFNAMLGDAEAVHGMDGWTVWFANFGERLFRELTLITEPNASPNLWEKLSTQAKIAWLGWLRAHPGMRRLEIALRGFFANGGRTAWLTVAVQGGGLNPDKNQFLRATFDNVADVAMLAAPGLDRSWQQAILEYAGPNGRGDLFAVLETPRYLLTREPRGASLDQKRWVSDQTPYEMANLETRADPRQTELRFTGFASDELLDTTVPRDDGGFGAAYGPWFIVENPLSTGPHDKYVIAPPSGHVAGVIASTDLKAGGGVHKAPANEQVLGIADVTTTISDREQGTLNVKGLNIIRPRRGAGIRVWGARTVAADPLWTYVNVRRLFLFVERSVRDAVQWAVFLPNSDTTRSDLKVTIATFLHRLYTQGMLDGETWQDAFTVQCDRDNNPDPDVRAGLLTVDVQMRPVYPAEFVRIRFRQSPMVSEVAEG